jgi:retron-type reverse transcriptase
MARKSSLSEKPRSHEPRRLADWINPTGAKKVHSLCDKIYKPKNLVMAWEKVKANRGAGGIDGQSLDDFEADLNEQLQRLHRELKDDMYQPQPVRQHLIPKAGQPDKQRALGIPTIYDRVFQQALLNRLEPIFEPVFDDASFGYRKGRSAKDALSKLWREIEQGDESYFPHFSFAISRELFWPRLNFRPSIFARAVPVAVPERPSVQRPLLPQV